MKSTQATKAGKECRTMFNISRRDPFSDMLSLRDAMGQLLADSFVRAPGTLGEGGAMIVPAFDVSETEDAFIVEASVPGLKAEDLNITVENNVMTISGEIRREQETKERNYHHTERYYGKFQRSLTLPNTVKADAINASLKDGVLHLSIPKAEEIKPRRITVNVGG